ncbi:short-chain dehydrogenase [Mycena amicta]|nr:short-chain dehydrogenase [Mycena amicta]
MNARIEILKQVATKKWLTDQWTDLPLASTDLTGKTVVITGANRGCGFEAAKHFARMNVGNLILACRNADAGHTAAQQIVKKTGCTGNVTCWPLDLSSFESVCEFARRAEREDLHVDILVANAAIMTSKYSKTDDGWESSLQVNYLSTVLLTILLLPHMAQTTMASRPRILLLCSEAHYFIPRLQEVESPNILAELNDQTYCANGAVMDQRYFVTKLFILFFCRELAQRVEKTPSRPLVTTVSPGLCSTDLDIESSSSFYMRPVKRFVLPFIARTSEMGSRTIVHAAVAPETVVPPARYMANCRAEKESVYSLSEEGMQVQARLWDETMEILVKIDPKVARVLEGL